MPMSFHFELSDQDLAHFNAAIAKAKASASGKPEAEVTRILTENGVWLDNILQTTGLLVGGLVWGVIADRRGLKSAAADGNELEQWCRDSIAANPKALAEFKAGKDSAINAFKGPVMKAAKGKANPKAVDETLRRLLASS